MVVKCVKKKGGGGGVHLLRCIEMRFIAIIGVGMADISCYVMKQVSVN